MIAQSLLIASSVAVALFSWLFVRKQSRELEAMRTYVSRMSLTVIPGNHDLDVSVFVSHADGDHTIATRLRKQLVYMSDVHYVSAAKPRRSSVPLRFCLHTLGRFIPKEIREPFWNHLLEDRDEMIASGNRSWVIKLAMASQIAWVIAAGLKEVVVQLLGGAPKHH